MTGNEFRACTWNWSPQEKGLYPEILPLSFFYLMLPSPQIGGDHGAAMNGQGKSSHPSSLVGEIRKLFPKLVQKEETSIEHQVWTCRDGLQQLIAGFQEAGDKNLDQLREVQGGFLELFRHFYGKEEYKKLVEKLTDAAFFVYEDKGIGRAAARALYGQNLQGSVTRLEQFAACALCPFLKIRS